jgi:NADH-ubiquinone oxidoreductase chain 1
MKVLIMLFSPTLGFISFELGLLFFLCCMSLGVYTVIIAGWSSNSNYSLLGGHSLLPFSVQILSYSTIPS